MIPSYTVAQWQVGALTDQNMLKIRVTHNGVTTDYWVPKDPGNRDYQEYLAWREEGNTPKILSGMGV